MTPISFVKTAESYEVSLATINPQTLYDSGILRKDNGVMRGLPMNHTRFAYWVTICVVHLPERTETGGHNYCIGPTVRPFLAAIAGCKRYWIALNIKWSFVHHKLLTL